MEGTLGITVKVTHYSLHSGDNMASAIFVW